MKVLNDKICQKTKVFQKPIQQFSSLVQITTLSCFKANFSLFNSSVGRARQSNFVIALFHLQTFLWIWIGHVDLLLFTGNSSNNFLLFLCNRPLVFACEKFLTERVIRKKNFHLQQGIMITKTPNSFSYVDILQTFNV